MEEGINCLGTYKAGIIGVTEIPRQNLSLQTLSEKHESKTNKIKRKTVVQNDLTGGSCTNIEALRHSINSVLVSVSILVSWNRNSATGWRGAPICKIMGLPPSNPPNTTGVWGTTEAQDVELPTLAFKFWLPSSSSLFPSKVVAPQL